MSEEELTAALQPKDLFVRLYVLRGHGLAAKDSDRNSDPYVTVQLGKHKVSRRDKHLNDTCDPDFFQAFDIPCRLPGPSKLEIKVWVYDGIGDDLIGKTVIDIENRYVHAHTH
jgi:Ca2+-dependent lipid-binding protein